MRGLRQTDFPKRKICLSGAFFISKKTLKTFSNGSKGEPFGF
nr:MAG TPA: hypothetical protein [Bacteriophage sp.]